MQPKRPTPYQRQQRLNGAVCFLYLLHERRRAVPKGEFRSAQHEGHLMSAAGPSPRANSVVRSMKDT